MTSRRPMTRTYSGNGRTSSFSEEDSSSSNGRSESRNTYLSNVRPENRSTLCSVMAQLTEDIQPSFETTLKSKAVSENCNVKFTCVVSGYPAPELKWYKDDMEMDRYCGLPKYEIRRNGKTHTLHIYNCTLDDAAIYQVSASNSKGIVSCSGVLEVGTMSEYKIHQRFFAKLKQKAEKKKKDLEEHTKKEDKENIQKEELRSGLEHPQRKRSVPPPEERQVVKKPAMEEQPGETAEPNGINSAVKEPDPLTPTGVSSENEVSSSQDTLAKKIIKMSNGVGAGVASSSSSKSHVMGNGGENCYDGGISLAQFLAETLQSQAVDEKQGSPQEEKPKEEDVAVVGESQMKEEDEHKKLDEQEKTLHEACEKEQRKEVEVATEREKEKERQSSEVKRHIKGHKDHDHINIQASLSSMLHTVKDFFFGKNKKDSHDHTEHEDKDSDPFYTKTQPSQVDMPPSFQLSEHNPEVCQHTEEAEPMETDQTEEHAETVDKEEQSVSLEPLKDTDHKTPTEIAEESTAQIVAEAEDAAEAVEAKKVSLEPESSGAGEDESLSGPRVYTEPLLDLLAKVGSNVLWKGELRSDVIKIFGEFCPGKSGYMMHSQLQIMFPDILKRGVTECCVQHTEKAIIRSVEEKNSDVVSAIQESDHPVAPHQSNNQAGKDGKDEDVLPQAQASAYEECPCIPTFNKSESCLTPPHSPISTTDNHCLGETFSDEMRFVEKAVAEGGPSGEACSSNKLCEEEKAEVKFNKHPCSDINRSETTKLSAHSLEDRTELSESKIPDQVLSPVSVEVACSTQPEETKRTSLSQEMNVGFPPTSVPDGLENSDLKMQHKWNLSAVGEITEAHGDKVVLSSDFAFSHSEGDWLKEGLNSPSGKDLERNLCNILKTQEQATVGVENNKRNEALQCTAVNKEELDESKTLAESESHESGANLLEEGSNISSEDGPLENIPSIQISTNFYIPDVKESEPDLSKNEPFIIPKIEILEPDHKDCTLPLTILAKNKPESNLKEHDATHEAEIRIKDDSTADSPGLFPTHKGMQNNDDLSPTEKGNEVAKEKLEQQPPHVQSSEKLPQVGNSLIPIINVSYTDDKAGSSDSCPQRASETPTVPIFVVPPISVTCHESDPEVKLPSCIDRTETEISAGTQRGTMKGVDKNTTTKPEITKRSEDFEEMSEKGIKENPPTVLHETLKPKVVDSVPSPSKSTEDTTVPETFKPKSLKDAKIENSTSIEDFLKSKPSVERLCSKPPTYPSLSPASLRKFMSKAAPDSDGETASTAISASDRQSDKAEDDLSGGSTPTSSLSCESSPRVKRRDSLTLIRSATPEELASGARRKIFIPKSKEDIDGIMVGVLEGRKETPYMSPSQARRAALLQASTGQKTPPMDRRSPLLSRRKATLEVPKVPEETPSGEPASTKKEEKPAEKKPDPLKAPQVIRKIRGEPFPDASGHLKLWCQFFNVLSDSTVKWYKDEEEILEVKRSGGDESQVALAIVLASNQDCGVYGCTISNEYGTDTTDYLLSTDILSEILLHDDLEVGEEIEMTPLLFAKGLADYGSWGEKYFGRIFTETLQMGEGCAHKASKVKVIYGLDPIFESGSTCIIKVQNPIAYGTKQESHLAERNLDITKHECKVQNMIREYCKIFAAEARVVENFGFTLEVIPRYLMYRPAKSVPYATVEADLTGTFVKYCTMDPKGKLSMQNGSEVEKKCCTFQHWIHQWTHGNLLVAQLEGVETKITNIKVVTKSKGYQGLTECGSPEVFDQFMTLHQCNYYCGLLGLHTLKTTESLQQPAKIKSSRSPLLNRKLGSNSPQPQRKGHSPQMSRKAISSPNVVRKVQETEDSKADSKTKLAESPSVVETR